MTETSNTQFNSKQFTSQTATLTRLLNDFSNLLDQEAQAIKKNDSEALIQASTAKQNLSIELDQATAELNLSLTPLSLNLADFTHHEKFSKLPVDVQNNVKSLISQIETCHDKNLANGMSIQILSNINQHALDLMSGKQGQDVKLYGSSGEKTHSGDQKSFGKA